MSGSRVAKLRAEWNLRKPLLYTSYGVPRRGGVSFREYKRAYLRRKR